MLELNDVSLLIMSDLFIAGDTGRMKARIITLAGNIEGASYTDSLDILEAKGLISVIKVRDTDRLSRVKLTELGLSRMQAILNHFQG